MGEGRGTTLVVTGPERDLFALDQRLASSGELPAHAVRGGLRVYRGNNLSLASNVPLLRQRRQLSATEFAYSTSTLRVVAYTGGRTATMATRRGSDISGCVLPGGTGPRGSDGIVNTDPTLPGALVSENGDAVADHLSRVHQHHCGNTCVFGQDNYPQAGGALGRRSPRDHS